MSKNCRIKTLNKIKTVEDVIFKKQTLSCFYTRIFDTFSNSIFANTKVLMKKFYSFFLTHFFTSYSIVLPVLRHSVLLLNPFAAVFDYNRTWLYLHSLRISTLVCALENYICFAWKLILFKNLNTQQKVLTSSFKVKLDLSLYDFVLRNCNNINI